MEINVDRCKQAEFDLQTPYNYSWQIQIFMQTQIQMKIHIQIQRAIHIQIQIQIYTGKVSTLNPIQQLQRSQASLPQGCHNPYKLFAVKEYNSNTKAMITIDFNYSDYDDEVANFSWWWWWSKDGEGGGWSGAWLMWAEPAIWEQVKTLLIYYHHHHYNHHHHLPPPHHYRYCHHQFGKR